MQDFTLHTHTIGFDGRNTPAQMINQARAAGMRAIGISNHFIVHPQIKDSDFYRAATARGYNTIYAASFDEVMARFIPHYAELEKLAASADIKVYRGMEVDFFQNPDWRNEFLRACDVLRPDYLIGSAHFVYYDGMLRNVHDIQHATPEIQDAMLRTYWENVAAAGESGLFTWLAHLDLPKKCGLGLGADWTPIHADVVARIGAAGVGVEINTAAMDTLGSEPYPSKSILELVARHNIPVLISDDAHRVEHIGRHFERAEQFARGAGVKNFITLQKILDFRHKTM